MRRALIPFDLSRAEPDYIEGLHQWNQACVGMSKFAYVGEGSEAVFYTSLPTTFILASMNYSCIKRGGIATDDEMQYDLENALLSATLQTLEGG